MKLLLIIIFFIGFCYLEPVRYEAPEVQSYIFKCHTDQECFDEEEACLKSGECVRNR